MVFNELGALRLLQDRPDQAETEHREALRLALRIKSEGDRAEALAGLGRCALATGRLDEAQDKFEQAREIFLSIHAREAAEMDAELRRLPPQ